MLHTLADDRIDQSHSFVVAIDQDFARHGAVGERHEAGNEPRVQRAEIAQGVPDVGRGCVDEDFFVNGGHGMSPCLKEDRCSTVIASEAKQSISLLAETWIASSLCSSQ